MSVTKRPVKPSGNSNGREFITLVIGALLGLALFLVQLATSLLGALLFNTFRPDSMEGVLNTGLAISYGMQILALALLFPVAKKILNKYNFSFPGHIAVTSLITTHMSVGALLAAIQAPMALVMFYRLGLFVILGIFFTLLLSKLFGRIKDDEHASFATFVILTLSLVGGTWLTQAL